MRIIINCTGGGSHSMMLLDHTTVLDVKHHIAKKEGVAVAQQLLLFAGRELGPDSARLLDELALDTYSLAHEVVVYMQQQLADPVRIFLCQPSVGPCQLHPEVVESSSNLRNIMALLTKRRLTCREFPVAAPLPASAALAAAAGSNSSNQHCSGASQGGSSSSSMTSSSSGGILPSCVVVKREDGSCCSRVKVTEECSIARVNTAVEEMEGTADPRLTFYQAADGCLHVVAGPATADPYCTETTHTVYSRSSIPQMNMLVKEPGSGSCQPYTSLVKELAVMP